MGSDMLEIPLGRVVDAGVRRVSLWGFERYVVLLPSRMDGLWLSLRGRRLRGYLELDREDLYGLVRELGASASLMSNTIYLGDIRIAVSGRTEKGRARCIIALPPSHNHLWKALHRRRTRVRVLIEIADQG
jgi:hypothetical protein